MKAAVYRHFSASGELLYVGYSVNPFARNYKHMKSADWKHEITKITVEWFPSHVEAFAAEKKAIMVECPRENLQHMPDDLFKLRKIKIMYRRTQPSELKHAQLDALEREFGMRPDCDKYKRAKMPLEVTNLIREEGRELLASEVGMLQWALNTTFKRLDRIGLHRRNPG